MNSPVSRPAVQDTPSNPSTPFNPHHNTITFVELLARSNFSFLQGASHPEEMALQAKALGYKGLALCDLNGLYGVVRGFQAIEYPSQFTSLDLQIQPHSDFRFYAGAEMQLAQRNSVALLPLNKDGYTNLCQLITESKRPCAKGFSTLTLENLIERNDHLIALALPPWKESHLEQLRRAFDQRFYLPVWKDYTWQSLDFYRQALQLEAQGYELVATSRPLMHAAERKPLHDVMTCILHKTTLKEAKTRLLSNGECHLKPLDLLAKIWRDRPDLLNKTAAIAKQINFSLKELRYEYPEEVRPPGKSANVYLRELVDQGLARRFPQGIPAQVQKTVDHELELIQELGYEDYFLTLWDVCQFAERQGILHQGRGSAANSIVCYALRLTAVDPTRVQLLFERFISKERGEPPDIDIDFESGRREEVIQYIYQKYGSHHAAMVCTVISYRSRMALRECGKVLGLNLTLLERAVKYMGREGLPGLVQNPQLAKEWNLSERTFQLWLQMAQALVGFPRHLGIHTGGFLITKRPITECVPVERATMENRYVIQWNKDDLTVLKMLKIDVLGLGMLSALEKCFTLLREHKGLNWDLYHIPEDDLSTYAMIQKADTVGTFQIESRAQMSLLPRLKPKNFYDLVIEVAIVRPGPIQGGMVHPFIRRRDGLEPVTYAHPDLRPILEKTCGVPIFQEQIMQMASAVAGFSPGEADELRRIMSSSWKKSDLMKGLRQRLLSGMLEHGIPLSYAEQIYQTIVGFASYGFPESHAASFALLTYASCYIKCHHPEVFVVSLLNSQPMGFYSPRSLIADAQRHQVKFLGLDLQKSDYDYKLEGSAVRVGFRAIRGLREQHIAELVTARGLGFASLADALQRTRLRKSVWLQLAASGALSCFGLNAREALWKIQGLCLDPENLFFAREGDADGGDADRGDVDGSSNNEIPIEMGPLQPQLPKESDWEQMRREFHTHGYSLVHHPLGILRPQLKNFTSASQLLQFSHGRRVQVAGLLSLDQRPPTAKGVAFLTLEDESGLINIVLMPDVYQKFRLVIAQNSLLQISGKVERTKEVIHIRAREISALRV